MQKLIRLTLLSALLVCSSLFAQDHLLISEFAVTPTEGEFVEIYNPTATPVDLTNYYLTDATFSGGGTFYYQIVEGGGGGGAFADFNARFPAGAMIGPGEHQTIALNGSINFNATYGVDPTYELYEDDATADGIPDMLEAVAGSVAGQGGLSDAGEVVVLYAWDGASDLVQDVDYVVWGDKVEAINKTGVSIDGPDADTDSSAYAPDTPIADQTTVNTDNDADDTPHDSGMTAQRKLDFEDVETWAGGNGMTGHDETSENTSYKGGIWSFNGTPTPGTRSFGRPASDSLTIADLQFLRAADIGPTAIDDSPFLGDTLTVTGIAMHHTRDLFLGNRWGGFLSDGHGGPWSGFFIIQNDSAGPGAAGTLITSVQPGDIITVTGPMQEFPTNANTQSISQFALLTDPVVPIDFVAFGQALPDTVVLTPGDIGATGSAEDPQLTERWESALVRFENLTVLSNFAGQPGNQMTAGDASGTISIDDYSLALREFLDSNSGVWPGFPTGTAINITGFMRDVVTGGQGRTTINPLTFEAIEITSSPPALDVFRRAPSVPTSTDNTDVTAEITSATSTIASAEVSYRVDGGAYQQVPMVNTTGATYSGTIPSQTDGALIEYFITATDVAGANSQAPGDTAAAKFFYFARDAGPTIFDVQFTPFAGGRSGVENLEVTVTGIATTDTTDFSFYFIQDGTDAWSGVHIDDNVNNVRAGDNVTVTGTVRERFSETQIREVTNVTINSSGNTVFDPVVKQTGELTTGASAESYEGMLMRVENVTVSTEFPDGFPGFGEWSVDDGSGELRCDDLGNIAGQTADTTFALGDLLTITAIQYFSFGNYKLTPRNETDIVRDPVSVEPGEIPLTFVLAQNYPNPFNPETTIRYQLAAQSEVKIEIFNILGQRVKTLLDETRPAGSYAIQWNGTNDSGRLVSSGVYIYKMKAADFVDVQKMLFLK